MFLSADDDKKYSLKREAWEPKHPAPKQLTWLGKQTECSSLAASLLLQKPCRHRRERWSRVLARAEMPVTSTQLMQAMLAKTRGKPWPALITLWRGITLPFTMIRLCQKEIFSTFAIINICWNALKYCLIKLLLTTYKAASLGLFTQLSVSCW